MIYMSYSGLDDLQLFLAELEANNYWFETNTGGVEFENIQN